MHCQSHLTALQFLIDADQNPGQQILARFGEVSLKYPSTSSLQSAMCSSPHHPSASLRGFPSPTASALISEYFPIMGLCSVQDGADSIVQVPCLTSHSPDPCSTRVAAKDTKAPSRRDNTLGPINPIYLRKSLRSYIFVRDSLTILGFCGLRLETLFGV
jgi:hypothetical protein